MYMYNGLLLVGIQYVSVALSSLFLRRLRFFDTCLNFMYSHAFLNDVQQVKYNTISSGMN